MKCDEIFAALAMLEKERGISQTFMMDKIVQALTTAYKRDHEGVENVVVDVDEGKRELKMFVQKEVVDEVENPGTQMSLDDAKAISAKYNVGDIVNIPVDHIEFGRLGAGNGKAVVIQGLREAESGMVYDEYNSKQHEILTGVVTRIDPRTGNASLRIGTGTEATDAILLAGEQVKGETLIEGQRIKVYLVDVRRQSRGPQVVISRTHPGLVKRLFELEVPEIYDGTVEIRSIAREAGSRTKMAVWSNDENVDPIGACVGPHGQRVNSIVEEQRGEKNDIIKNSDDPAEYIAAALAPRTMSPCRRGQGLPRHRARRSAFPCHRQGGAERTLSRAPRRLQDRHQARELSRGYAGIKQRRAAHAESKEDPAAPVCGLPRDEGQTRAHPRRQIAARRGVARLYGQKARARRLRLPEQRMPQAGAQIPRARARAGHGHPRERLRRNGKGDGKRWINCSI